MSNGYFYFIRSDQISCSVMSDSLQPHELQHARPPCPSPTPGAYSNSCPFSWSCHPTISSSAIPFSCLQSFPASGSLPMSQCHTSGGESIGVSALVSVLPMNIQDWFSLGWTCWISLLSKGLSSIFSSWYSSLVLHNYYLHIKAQIILNFSLSWFCIHIHKLLLNILIHNILYPLQI